MTTSPLFLYDMPLKQTTQRYSLIILCVQCEKRNTFFSFKFYVFPRETFAVSMGKDFIVTQGPQSFATLSWLLSRKSLGSVEQIVYIFSLGYIGITASMQICRYKSLSERGRLGSRARMRIQNGRHRRSNVLLSAGCIMSQYVCMCVCVCVRACVHA